MVPWRLLNSSRARRLRNEAEELSRFYEAPRSDEEIEAVQLERWNREWRDIVSGSPYYADLKSRLGRPEVFSSWDEFTERMPVLTRADVQAHGKSMAVAGKKPDFMRTTGGSTAQPIQMPAWNSEAEATRSHMWLGRGWFGVTPESRLFLLWGHAHLLGAGWRRYVNLARRALSDHVTQYHRFSAYDLQPAKLRRAAETMLRWKPEYMIGYSVALDLFARANAELRDALRGLGLKVVIGAAEAFPHPDSAERLSDLFGCPVAMEYGSVETGLIAHVHPSGGYHVFWRNYFIEAVPNTSDATRGKIRVTSLFPRCFPLVRYEIGDEIELEAPMKRRGVTRFARVAGRCNDYLLLRDGTPVHSELFTHAVRGCSAVSAYQIVQAAADIEIRCTSAGTIDEAAKQAMRDALGRVHPELSGVRVKQVERLEQTVAGKTRMVIRTPA